MCGCCCCDLPWFDWTHSGNAVVRGKEKKKVKKIKRREKGKHDYFHGRPRVERHGRSEHGVQWSNASEERKVELLRKGVEEVGVYEKGGFWYSGIPLMGVYDWAKNYRDQKKLAGQPASPPARGPGPKM